MKYSLYKLVSVLFVSLHLHANPVEKFWSVEVVQPVAVASAAVGTGSLVKINSKSEIFLGQLVNHDGSFNSLMTLDPKKSVVKFTTAAHFATALPEAQNVLKLFQQQGGTCTGYAIDDFILQNHISGLEGNDALKSAVADEEGRTSLLADAINQYYLVLQHRFSIQGILNGYGTDYGFSCRKKMFMDMTAALDFLKTSLKTGRPVLISFFIGQVISDGPFKLERVDQTMTADKDTKLWLPRKIGERKGGGHSVVATGNFTVGGIDYAVMLDSDWTLPRVWDLNQALGDHTAFNEVEFFTCQ